MIYDARYMTYDIWHMKYDILQIIYDIWHMKYDILQIIYDIWYMIYDIIYSVYDIWYMICDIWCTIYDIWYIIYDICVIILCQQHVLPAISSPRVTAGRWQHGSIQANVHDKRDASRQRIWTNIGCSGKLVLFLMGVILIWWSLMVVVDGFSCLLMAFDGCFLCFLLFWLMVFWWVLEGWCASRWVVHINKRIDLFQRRVEASLTISTEFPQSASGRLILSGSWGEGELPQNGHLWKTIENYNFMSWFSDI